MARILIGTSGWHYDSWRGPFFPKGLPPRNQLQYYASQFQTAELNGVFYRTPTVKAVTSWKEQTGKTKVNYSLGYHLRNGMFGHDGAYGTDLSVNPTNGMVAVFMIQCSGPDLWAARDLFLKTATEVFQKNAR